MILRRTVALGLGAAVTIGGYSVALANACPGKPDALGTARTLTVNPFDYPMVGKVQFMETLRLSDREIVISFDDGPVAPHTNKILDALAAECVKATFFLLGTNVADSPALARRAYDEGHTIGTHGFSHQNLSKISTEQAKQDIELGFAAVAEALGPSRTLAPFFRAPYLALTKPLERHLVLQGQLIFSTDADSQDWMLITAEKLVERIIERVEKAGKGILLLHDIQAVTARALPMLLVELKRRDYRIVHVAPGPRLFPNTATIVGDRAF